VIQRQKRNLGKPRLPIHTPPSTTTVPKGSEFMNGDRSRLQYFLQGLVVKVRFTRQLSSAEIETRLSNYKALSPDSNQVTGSYDKVQVRLVQLELSGVWMNTTSKCIGGCGKGWVCVIPVVGVRYSCGGCGLYMERLRMWRVYLLGVFFVFVLFVFSFHWVGVVFTVEDGCDFYSVRCNSGMGSGCPPKSADTPSTQALSYNSLLFAMQRIKSFCILKNYFASVGEPSTPLGRYWPVVYK